MNRPLNPLGPALPSPVGAGPTDIGACANKAALPSPTGEAGAPSLSTPNDGYGKRPRCTVCGRGFYGCICDVPEPDVMPVEDMKRIMPRLFERTSFGMLPAGWNRIEL